MPDAAPEMRMVRGILSSLFYLLLVLVARLAVSVAAPLDQLPVGVCGVVRGCAVCRADFRAVIERRRRRGPPAGRAAARRFGLSGLSASPVVSSGCGARRGGAGLLCDALSCARSCVRCGGISSVSSVVEYMFADTYNPDLHLDPQPWSQPVCLHDSKA